MPQTNQILNFVFSNEEVKLQVLGSAIEAIPSRPCDE